MSILIKKALLNGKIQDIYVENNLISEIKDSINVEAEHKINAQSMAILPSFVNGHTHAAMTLFRGYADDMPLLPWLQEKIWPNEARLNEELIYQGSRLACLEMIKSGITFFNDMYWNFAATAKATNEFGMRAEISQAFIDFFDQEKAKEAIKLSQKVFGESKSFGPRVKFALGPHAIYTVSEESLLWCKDFAQKHNLQVHIHLSETEQEVKDCIAKHGLRPVEYLDKIGFLNKNVVAAHAVWLTEKEVEILGKRQTKVVHNPISNMKLSVCNVFPYDLFKKHKVEMCLGTDGTSSNNNLSMFDTMKIAALLQKHHSGPTTLPANECFGLATNAKCFNLNAGEIKEGKLADFNLINLKVPEMVPLHNLHSNIVYSANDSCVDTVVCDGKILMKNRKVENEEEVLDKVGQVAREFLG